MRKGDMFKTYRQLLATAHLSVDDRGFVVSSDGKSSPITVDGKELILPTPENLKIFRDAQHCVFHPFKESVNKKPSKGTTRLMRNIRIAIGIRVNEVATMLTEVIKDSDDHANFTPAQGKLLRAVPELEPTVIKYINKLAKEPEIVTFEIPRNREIEGRKMARVCVVGLNILEKVADLQSNFGGSQVRSKQLLDLYSFIFDQAVVSGNQVDASAYNYGSNDRLAPTIMAFLKSAEIIIRRLNYLVTLFNPRATICKLEPIPAEWMDVLEDTLENMRGEITSVPLAQDGDVVTVPKSPMSAIQQPSTPTKATEAKSPPWEQEQTVKETKQVVQPHAPRRLTPAEAVANAQAAAYGGQRRGSTGYSGNGYGVGSAYSALYNNNLTPEERRALIVNAQRQQVEQSIGGSKVMLNGIEMVYTTKGFMPLDEVLQQTQRRNEPKIPAGAVKGTDGKYYINTPSGYIEVVPEVQTTAANSSGLPVVTRDTPRVSVGGIAHYDFNGRLISVDEYERRMRGQQNNGYGNQYGNQYNQNLPPQIKQLTENQRRSINGCIMRYDDKNVPHYYRQVGNTLVEVYL